MNKEGFQALSLSAQSLGSLCISDLVWLAPIYACLGSLIRAKKRNYSLIKGHEYIRPSIRKYSISMDGVTGITNFYSYIIQFYIPLVSESRWVCLVYTEAGDSYREVRPSGNSRLIEPNIAKG